MSKVPLDLYAEVSTPDGTRYRWDANQPPGAVLRNFSFRTKVGEGFSDASGSLARRIDVEYPDLGLVNTVTVVGSDGSVAYEGRLSAQPRELSDQHSVGVTLTGWMAHAKDRKFTEVYVDRDLSGWKDPSLGRRAGLGAANYSLTGPEQIADTANGTAGIGLQFAGAWVTPYLPASEAWYDVGPGLLVGKVAYSWKRRAANVGTAAPWAWLVLLSSDDKASATVNSGALAGAGPSTGVFSPATKYRYAFLNFGYETTPAGADGAIFGIDWYKLAVYGNHGLTTRVGAPGEPEGVTASDVIRDIAKRFCPLLNTAEVQDTTYVLQHLAFRDRAYPYDAFLELNKFHLWNLAVWENRTLQFAPFDLTTADWEVRTDEPGVSLDLQGPAIDQLFNGIAVTYTDLLTGVRNIITPNDNTLLRDTSLENPWNANGIEHWDELELSTPTIAAQAVEIARIRLGENNRPKQPGGITVTGYIYDTAGNLQPGWKVRAGDTVALVNFPADNPRLIQETSWDDQSKTLTMSVDNPAGTLDAYLDRLSSGLNANGL